MYYPLLARHHLPNSKLLTSVGSHEHNLWWQNTLARILFILSRADAPLTKKENFGTSLSKSRISDPFCRTSGAQNMAIKFFFSGSKAARTSYRSFVRSSVNMQGGTHTHAASRLKFTSPRLWYCTAASPYAFYSFRWQKKKISELPSQNQEFLTHSVELPVHRTWQLSFSFREAKQLVHPIEVSSEVPWICKEAHTRMRPAALSSLPPALILSCRPH